MSNKNDLLARLDEGYATFRAAIAEIDGAQMAEVWLGSWALSDILAHIAGWHREMTAALERIARGERARPDGVDYSEPDPWNDRFVAERRELSPAQMIGELDDSFAKYREAAAAVPEDRFEPGRTVDRLLHGSGIDHYMEHGDQVQQWRRPG